MPPQARTPPASHPVFIWPTPEHEDRLFYVERDGRLPKYKNTKDRQAWDYGDAYEDSTEYPDHKLIHVSPQDGKNWSRWYYAADRITEDAYNWEYSQADLGGRKFDGIRRTYLVPRSSFSASSPAAGAVTPDVPVGLFTGYILATREQRRTGDEIFDSVYVIEVREYINRVTITSVASYDQSTAGILFVSEDLYYRGETYTPSGTLIEVAVANANNWQVTSGGVLIEFKQLTNDWWLVTNTDVIPQSGKTTTGSKFGGYLIQEYDTYTSFSWPAVLGTDGSLDHLGAAITGGIEITSWEDKGGTFRNIPRPLFKEIGYRGPCRATITEEWSTTRPILAGDNDRPFYLRPRPIVYIAPFLVFKTPPTLHGAAVLKADTGTEDPTWGQNTGSQRTFPATNATDWPTFLVVSVEVKPFRGGFFTRSVKVYQPEEIPATYPIP